MKLRRAITCPLELTHDVLKGKWKPIILWTLREPRSLADLERGIAGISQKMLLEQLKELQDFRIVDKKSFWGYPLKVEYFLTDRGRRLLDAVVIFQETGLELQAELAGKAGAAEEGDPGHPRKSG